MWVDSERELKGEVYRLVKALDEKQEWTKRIEVIQLSKYPMMTLIMATTIAMNGVDHILFKQ